MAHLFLRIQSLHPFAKFCLSALMIVINVCCNLSIGNLSIFLIWKKNLIDTEVNLIRGKLEMAAV